MHKVEKEIAGRMLSLETGYFAGQANGAVIARMGDTMVLCTAVCADEAKEDAEFLPLTVDYEEKLYAVGKIPGGFIRREGKPSEAAILASRLTDRPLRPLFPEGFRNEVQVVTTVLSVDPENDPTILSIIGASAALTISDIPFNEPVGAVRVGYFPEEGLVINPPMGRMGDSLLDLAVAGTIDSVNMVEAGAFEIPEEQILEAIRLGHEYIKPIIELQNELRKLAGKPKREFVPFSIPDELYDAVVELAQPKLDWAVYVEDKPERERRIAELKNEIIEALSEKYPDDGLRISAAFESILKQRVRKGILEEGKRPDGRGFDQIRDIDIKVGILPRTHGSALFTRGHTQALSIVTLGSSEDMQKLDGIGPEEFKRYMHHYNFPPYSVGEAKPNRGPGRREIGHGALAERALVPVVPPPSEFPYAIRVVSEILSSNGSTSMASVCGSSLALMDAGVPTKAAVAGIAMGLITDANRYAVLTDIQGIEDALGDMDFKVAGTESGVTAVQMDIKIKGLSYEIMADALQKARSARLYVLEKMKEVLPEPRKTLSPYAPRYQTVKINPERIKDLIGPAGKTIHKIIAETGVEIDIEDDGTVLVFSSDLKALEKAVEKIRYVTEDVEVGKIYRAKVIRVTEYGAFCEVLPGQVGLVHISQLTEGRVNRVEEVVNTGDEILVKVIGIDDLGRISLSRKLALKEMEEAGMEITETIDENAKAAALAQSVKPYQPLARSNDKDAKAFRRPQPYGRDNQRDRRRRPGSK
jgi:polyribonucleotide nucleotidyltransferase